MKFKVVLPVLVIFLVSLFSCSTQKANTKTEDEDLEKVVEIATSFGSMKFKLYNETPQHRDNFIKLASEGFYDSTLFHRVINSFMIQGGDPSSKNAKPNQQLGNGGPGYTIPAEFDKRFIHKKGALAAARQGDQVNPEKRSSGSQFYIVQGKKYSVKEMKGFEERNAHGKKQQLMNEFFQKPENEAYLTRLKEIKRKRDQIAMEELIKEIEPTINEEYAKDSVGYTPEQLTIYQEIGGTPHLDGGYTVFGEIIEGINILDSIASVATKPGDRPVEDIRMTVRVLN